MLYDSPVRTAVLGVLTEGPSTPREIIASVKQLAGTVWHPTGDAVLAAIERAMEAGHLQSVDQATRLELTSAGIECFRGLLESPWDGSNTVTGRVTVALKIRFIDVLTPEIARAVLTDLRQNHGDAIKILRADYSKAQRHGLPGIQWIQHELERHVWELRWLKTLQPPRRPCTAGGAAIELAGEVAN